MGLDQYLYAERNADRLPFKKLPSGSDYISGWDLSKPTDKTRYRKLLRAVDLVALAERDGQALLPTKGGFFFGSTDYDEHCVEVLKSTIRIIDRALQAPADTQFFYRSSW